MRLYNVLKKYYDKLWKDQKYSQFTFDIIEDFIDRSLTDLEEFIKQKEDRIKFLKSFEEVEEINNEINQLKQEPERIKFMPVYSILYDIENILEIIKEGRDKELFENLLKDLENESISK